MRFNNVKMLKLLFNRGAIWEVDLESNKSRLSSATSEKGDSPVTSYFRKMANFYDLTIEQEDKNNSEKELRDLEHLLKENPEFSNIRFMIDGYTITAMYNAIFKKDLPVFKLLLQGGFSISLDMRHDMTALDCIIAFAQGCDSNNIDVGDGKEKQAFDSSLKTYIEMVKLIVLNSTEINAPKLTE